MEDLIYRLREFRDARDWNQFHTSKDLAISISIEAGELLELFQWTDSNPEVTPDFRKNLSSEVADVFLYLLMLCDKAGIDLYESALNKLAENEKRFPVAVSKGVAKPK